MTGRPRHPKLGYFINAAKKRKQQQTNKSNNKRSKEQPPVEDNFPSDSSTPVESEVETEIESPPYSPLTDNNPIDDNNPNMDIDLNAASDDAIGTSSAGGETNHNINSRSISGSNAAGTGGGMRGIAPLPTGVRQKPMRTIRKYTKQYLLRVQNEGIETRFVRSFSGATAANNVISYGGIRYPFHDIPVNMLGFYLSKSEMAELSAATKATVKNVNVNIFNKTGVLTFETASSTTNIGNNNIGIYLCELSKDLNNKRTGQLPNQMVLIEEVMWGYPYAKWSAASTDFTPTDANKLGAQYVRRTLNNKFEYYTPQPLQTSDTPRLGLDTMTAPAIPYFDIWPFVSKRINASMNEGLFTTYSYKPKNGLVFSNQWVGNPDASLRFNNSRMPIYGSGLATIYNTSGTPGLYNTGGQPAEQETSYPNVTQKFPFVNSMPNYYQWTQIENAAGHLGTREQIPPLVIGIEPLTTEIQTQGRFELVKCHVDILVQCELDMEIIIGTDYTNPNTFDIIRPDYKNPTLSMYNVPSITYRLAENSNRNLINKETYDVYSVPLQSTPVTNVSLPNAPTRDTVPEEEDFSRRITRSQTQAEREKSKEHADLSKILNEEPAKLLNIINRRQAHPQAHPHAYTNEQRRT